MPFVPAAERSFLISNPSKADKPGQLTYLIYKEMKRLWNEKSSWTCASDIHFDFVSSPEDCLFLVQLHSNTPKFEWQDVTNAASLAWQVFFNLVVMDYELKKRKENGDVL